METALERVQEALSRAGSHQRYGGNWSCPGPRHANGDRDPSLSVKQGAQGAVLKCHTGCSYEEVIEALRLSPRDLFDEPNGPRDPVARYIYRDEQGQIQFAKFRYQNKKFATFHPEEGDWVQRIGDAKRVLYRLPQLLQGIADGKVVWVTEGEKDADRLALQGEIATCNFDGAGSRWHPEYTEWFKGAERVIIVADRDDSGVKHAKKIQEALKAIVPNVKIVQSKTDGAGDDISDHLDAGFDLDELIPLEAQTDIIFRIRRGGCILDAPKIPAAIWGREEDILWAAGQSLIIAGHDGTGKTTLAGNLIRARLGLGSGRVLGLPVIPGERNILVLMMDRPQQAMSSLARLFSENDRKLLDAKLRVWLGPPPEDLAHNTRLLADLCQLADADTCIIDSLKDAAIPLSDDAVGAGWNRARQAAIVAGTELLELHHPRKPPPQEADKPPELSDLYGSRWIPAGIGSAIVLHGKAGEPYVKLYHRKPVVTILGPWDLLLQEDGEVQVSTDQTDLVSKVARYGKRGITAAEMALELYGTDTKNELERARRILEKLNRERRVVRSGGARGGAPALYKITHEITENMPTQETAGQDNHECLLPPF